MINPNKPLFVAAASWFVSMKRLEEKYPNPTRGQKSAITSQSTRFRAMLRQYSLDTTEMETAAEVIKAFELIWREAKIQSK